MEAHSFAGAEQTVVRGSFSVPMNACRETGGAREVRMAGRIEFPNGWSFDIHEVRNGEVYYQRWPPGVENQGMFANLSRMEQWMFSFLVDVEEFTFHALP